MAEVRKLTDNIFVASQLTAADVAEVDAMNFRSILCNRPDNEQAEQPAYENIRAQADALGMAVEFQPVNGSVISDEDIDDFAENLQNLPMPILAYCRTGTRCTVLWALSQAGHRPIDEILQITAAAGYSLDALRPRLEERAAEEK